MSKGNFGKGRESPRRPARWPWILAGIVLFTGIGAFITHKVSWYLTEHEQRRSLAAEVIRLGGQACVREGEYDFVLEIVYISVNLEHTNIDDQGLAKIASMPAFRRVLTLNLADTQIGDGGVGLLQGHPSLIGLDLSRTAITDKSFEFLAAVPGLNGLKMSGTNVGDEGLEILRRRLPQSRRMLLDVTGTAVTEEGVRKLFAKFSQWNIIYGNPENFKYTR